MDLPIRYRTAVAKNPVGSDDWVIAAHQRLIAVGPAAVTVEGVARDLGVTKGSFYWHLRTRAELLTAALDRWAKEQTQALIDETEAAAGSAQQRIQVLFRRVAVVDPGLLGEAALYAAAPTEPLIAAALTRVTKARIGYVASLLEQIGMPADQAGIRARLALAMVIGQRALAHAVPALALDAAAGEQVTRTAIEILTRP
jgi:AcrR family transcriptional regulator